MDNAYRISNLMLKAYGVLEGDVLSGYMKVLTKHIKGKTPNNRDCDIVFKYCKQGDGYDTFIGYDLNIQTGEFSSDLERVIETKDHFSSGSRIDVIPKQFNSDEGAFYNHVLGLLANQFSPMFESAEIAGKKVLAEYLRPMSTFPTEFTREFSEAYSEQKAYVFDRFSIHIEPQDWGLLTLSSHKRDKHPASVSCFL